MKSTTAVPPGSEAARKSRSAPRKFSVDPEGVILMLGTSLTVVPKAIPDVVRHHRSTRRGASKQVPRPCKR